jgi:hypothetical protein
MKTEATLQLQPSKDAKDSFAANPDSLSYTERRVGIQGRDLINKPLRAYNLFGLAWDDVRGKNRTP